LALGSRRRLPHLLDCWNQQPDENGDDGDHHEQLNKGEGVSLRPCGRRCEGNHESPPGDANQKTGDLATAVPQEKTLISYLVHTTCDQTSCLARNALAIS